MNKLISKVGIILVAIFVFAGLTSVTNAAGLSSCTTIQDGGIVDSVGNPVSIGYDQWGYNYQAHMFNGFYNNFSRPAVPVTEGDTLIMKWSDSWLANVDCDGDSKLDRGLIRGEGSTGISMGWLTNQVNGTYLDENDEVQDFTNFIKIVWVGPGGSLWGQYEIIQEVLNDPAGGFVGLFSKVLTPGFGLNSQWTTL